MSNFEFTQSANSLIDKSHVYYALVLSLYWFTVCMFDLTVQYSVQFPT